MHNKEKEYHQILARHFMAKPVYCDGDKRELPNRRKLIEQPFQQAAADMKDEWEKTLLEYEFLQGKVEAGMLDDLLDDYGRMEGPKEEVRLVGGAVRLSGHVLKIEKKQLPNQLYGRLVESNNSKINTFLEQVGKNTQRPWIKPFHACLMKPGGTLVRTLTLNRDLPVGCICVSGEAGLIVSGCFDDLLVWNLHNGVLLKKLKGHRGLIAGVCITNDGRLAVSGAADGKIKVWDLRKGKEIISFDCASPITSVDLTPDGAFAASGSEDKKLKIWNLKSLSDKPIIELSCGLIKKVRISADGSRVAYCSEKLAVWDIKDGIGIRISPYEKCPWSDRGVGLYLSSDKNLIVMANSLQIPCIQVWSIIEGSGIQRVQISGKFEGHTKGHSIEGICVTPNEKWVITASGDRTIKIWDLKAGTEICTLNGHSNTVTGVSVTADGKYLVSSSYDGTMMVWDLTKVTRTDTLRHLNYNIHKVFISTDGSLAASAKYDYEEHTLEIWDVKSAVQVDAIKEDAYSAPKETSSDGRLKIIPGPPMLSYDLSHVIKDLFSNTNFFIGSYSVHSFSSNSSDGSYWINQHKGMGVAVGINGRGQLFQIFTPEGKIGGWSITENGSLAICAIDTKIYVWDLFTNKIIRELKGHANAIGAVSISEDGIIAISGSKDKTAKIWNVQTGEELNTLHGHTEEIVGVSIAPKSLFAVTVSKDKYIKIWDLATFSTIASFASDSSLSSCAIAHDGRAIVAGGASGVVHFLRLENYPQ